MEEVTNSVQNKLGGLQEVVFIHRLFQINFFSLIHSCELISLLLHWKLKPKEL